MRKKRDGKSEKTEAPQHVDDEKESLSDECTFRIWMRREKIDKINIHQWTANEKEHLGEKILWCEIRKTNMCSVKGGREGEGALENEKF